MIMQLLGRIVGADKNNVESLKSWENDLFLLAYALTDCRNKASELTEKILQQYTDDQLSDNGCIKLSVYHALCQHWMLSLQHVKPLIAKETNTSSNDDTDIRQYVHQLPVYQKVVVVLVDIAGLTYQEVANVVDADQKRVRRWLSLARQSIIAQKNCQLSHKAETIASYG
jgi:DNA-directed RNA polymerase specialized sigma24 family protein